MAWISALLLVFALLSPFALLFWLCMLSVMHASDKELEDMQNRFRI